LGSWERPKPSVIMACPDRWDTRPAGTPSQRARPRYRHPVRIPLADRSTTRRGSPLSKREAGPRSAAEPACGPRLTPAPQLAPHRRRGQPRLPGRRGSVRLEAGVTIRVLLDRLDHIEVIDQDALELIPGVN